MNMELTMANVGENDIDADYASFNIPGVVKPISERSRQERASLFGEVIRGGVQQIPKRSRSQAGSNDLGRGRAGPYRGNACIIPGTLKEQVLRRETFDKLNWPLSYPHPDKLAEAGFSFEGYRDIVRCHYCDGTLQNWEPDDEPMEEHKRWFPECKFVKLF